MKCPFIASTYSSWKSLNLLTDHALLYALSNDDSLEVFLPDPRMPL